jgi:Tfp pilus assembly protein PilP
MLEGAKNGSFHAVSRWSPDEDDPFRAAMLTFSKMAGLDQCDSFGLLGQYTLERLEYKGRIVVGDPPIAFGLVKTPDGRVEPVHQGEGLGARYGQVAGIADDSIEAVEIAREDFGEYREYTRRLYRASGTPGDPPAREESSK